MSSSSAEPPRALQVVVGDRELSVSLDDGRRMVVPIAWFPRLARGGPDERQRWELLGDGEGIHWPDLDEDIGVAGLLRGRGASGAL